MTFLSALTLLLVAAKLFGFAHYSYLVAFSPILASFALVVFVSAVAVLGPKLVTSRRY